MILFSKKTLYFFIFILIITPIFFAMPGAANSYGESMEATANNLLENKFYSINIDHATIEKGYTVAAFNDNLKLSLIPGILKASTGVSIIELHEEFEFPWKLDLISNIYQFEFINKTAYKNHVPFYIQFSYSTASDKYKQVFFYDKNYKAWRPLPTKDYPKEKFVRSLIHLPFARIAVFEFPKIMTAGRASWYAYKGGNYAASPDFPKGSRLRVRNQENNKFIDVEINDYGPDRGLHPDRVIDLDKVAFKQLASLSQGVIEVEIEPLYIVPDNEKTLGISRDGVGSAPNTAGKSFIIFNENTEKIILSENPTTTLPLASLSKLVAIKVFLDTKPNLNQTVAYNAADENYNYEFCEPWESARLKVDDGDMLSVEDLLYSSLVGSANNTVESLVRVSGLERNDFIKKMNDLASSWGAASTYFAEPTGLSPENVSSAYDYAIITKEVFKHPIIEKASVAREYSFKTLNTGQIHKLKNTNQLIRLNRYSIVGSKTGYLDEAGYCLMSRVAVADNILIIISFGVEDRATSFLEVEELIQYGIRKTQK
ncbi:MAG: RlpA-like double-psi beta-barrel domain-containing protein [Patescibacteria group bacterium]|nr:RlpA-like double-psi beta-barrel domain-containing protein [Patescibacteria group bacterium]